VLHVYLGIDAGSTTTKFALLNEQEHVVDTFYSNNRGDPLEVIKKALGDLYKKYADKGVALKIKALGTTGYGELLFAKALGADYHTVETVAHATAARKYVPDVSFILDIGGQDMKAITITNNIITNITLNEACSSGCGSFLENFAATLNIPVEDISEAAFNAKNPAELGSRCTVFMNSTIVTEQKQGKLAEDIMAGLCRSIIENVFTKVVRVANFSALGDKIVVQGGTFKNDAVLRVMEQ
jgi:predicted CoA-substrate-specific enzyme activase